MKPVRATALHETEDIPTRCGVRPRLLVVLSLFGPTLIPCGRALAFTAPFQTSSIFSTSDDDQTILRHILTYSQDARSRSLTLPRFDVYHRFAKDVELDLSLPFEFVQQRGNGTHFAFSSADIAVGYRLHKGSDKSWVPSIGIAPQLGFPSAAPQYGIGTSQPHAYLPLIVEKDVDKWSIYCNVAYAFNPGAGNRNYGFIGTAVTRQINDDLDIGGEIYHRGSTSTSTPETTGFDIGMKYSTAKNQALYFSIGSAPQNPDRTNQVSAYFGYQLAF